MITFMSPLAIMPKTLVFAALLLLHASLHARDGWGGGGIGGGGEDNNVHVTASAIMRGIGGEDNNVHVTASGDHAQNTGIYSAFASTC